MRSDLTDRREGIDTGPSLFVSAASLRERLDWFNKLRWGAGLGVLAAVLVADVLLDLTLPVRGLLTVGLGLLLLNTTYVWRNARLAPIDIRAEIRLVKLQMLGDLVVLTVLLNLSGGVENPLLFLYMVHVILASLLLRGREIFMIAWLAILLFTGEVVGEYLHWLPHHHLLTARDITHELPFILMTLASFWLVLLFCAYIGASIMKHNRAIKDELVERQAALIQADQDKLAFFRFVTHEIKSPVNTAQSAVETALEIGGADLPDDVEDLLERAVGRLEQATDIVLNLADLTRGGDLQRTARQDIDLGGIATRVAESLEDLASRRGVSIRVKTPGRPVHVCTHASMAEKVVTNLVSNAVRYNRDGGRVQVEVIDLDDRVRVSVFDEGIGIAAEDRDRIFDEFYRAPAAQEMSHLGTGLGLSIVKRFTELLGGTLAVRSTVGQGSVFVVELPRGTGGEADATATGGMS